MRRSEKISQGWRMSEFSILRQAAALTVPEAAQIVGIATSTAYRWDHGEVAALPEALHTLRKLANPAPVTAPSSFRFIDLFAGIGGLRRGFDAIGGTCVCTSEWDRFAQATYRANYRQDGPDHVFLGDITKVDASDIPAHDVLLAGFPCQPFSIAGVSKKNSLGRLHGFRDAAQGTLFFDVARIIDHHRPNVILLENVKNLLSHDSGKTFAVIRATLKEELGYNISVRVIDARSFVPQHRERIFIAGVRKELGLHIDLASMVLPDPASGPRLRSILHPEDGSEPTEVGFTDAMGRVDGRYILSDKLWKYLQDYAEKHRQKGNGFGFGLSGPDDVTRTLSARYHKDGSEILVSRGLGRNPRRLTPRECARLMGFDRPDGAEFVLPVSDTQAYRQFGNAVVVPVVERVATHLAPTIQSAIDCVQTPAAVAAE